jgi:acetyl-CoA carboxylase, biotin carboxylase subunit
MFKKLLIANRGEIAVRIQRACRELGIKTVAIYSEADRHAMHVRYADEAYFLGPSLARDSYLRGDKIIDIARKCAVDAIHPGYGFLAERADFAADCADAGLVFIGPRPSAIAAMGDKAIARATIAKAGVRIVPGTESAGPLRDDELLAIAPNIGFPLLIKATAGGGGKGMREVRDAMEMPELLQSARREAESAFGDGNVYLEKTIEAARHIEYQIMADQYGEVIHLGERECSIQRRHQKLIEESPSPMLAGNDDLRQRMGAVAIQAARAVDYANAGTIEFLVDKDLNFYFLEMNTRLQVEHPVTEAVTGIDIVAEQIRVANGRHLSRQLEDIQHRGAAIECRINSEDPYNDFLPSTGRISLMQVPTGPGVRIDTGVYVGFEISTYYDPLISKLIIWGETRPQAIIRMRRALEEYRVVGVRTNIPFHQTMMSTYPFITGNYNTRFVEDQFTRLDAAENRELYLDIAALMASLVAHGQAERQTQKYPDRMQKTNWKWAGRHDKLNR